MILSMRNGLNPYNPKPNYDLLLMRWGGLALLIAADVTGSEILAWLSLPVLSVVLIISWGLHVVFVENLNALPRLSVESRDGDDNEDLPGVTVIVPARNEDIAIEGAVRSLDGLDYPEFEILVIDDQSTDDTPQILDRLAKELPHVRVLQGPPLQEGWMGKSNAMWLGARQADSRRQWLLFTDADVVFHPKALRRAVSFAEAHRLDFLTCIPYLVSGSVIEELVTPLAWANLVLSSDSRTKGRAGTPAVGVGAFMLVRRETYVSAGGHAAIYNSASDELKGTFDETMLARLIAENGGATVVAWSSDLLEVRRYYGFRHMHELLVTWIRACAGDIIPHQIAQLGLKLLLFVVPLPLAFAGILWQTADSGFSLAFAFYAALAFLIYLDRTWTFRRFRAICRIRPGLPWLHPLGGLLRSWFELAAIVDSTRGKRALWRGRPFVIPGPPK